MGITFQNELINKQNLQADFQNHNFSLFSDKINDQKTIDKVFCDEKKAAIEAEEAKASDDRIADLVDDTS